MAFCLGYGKYVWSYQERNTEAVHVGKSIYRVKKWDTHTNLKLSLIMEIIIIIDDYYKMLKIAK